MDKTRIYGKKAFIDTEKVRDFFDKRAAGASPEDIATVLLGDARILTKRNAYSKDTELPLLNVGPETRVLDLGCGIGRWAGFLLPACGFYCGVDFSPEMIRITEQVCRKQGGNFALHCMSVVEAACQGPAFYGGKFDAVIAAGVLPYINDPDAERMFRRLPGLLAERCVILFHVPVGLEKRLTLKDFPSEALQTEYSAIYRTPEEYTKLFAPLFDAGFSVAKQELSPDVEYSDTRRGSFLLKR